ncbi:MAG: hypothetical protein ABA06_03930 [Parcubacteria bacterium C7867-001]|nr:MAG: hypothetical protein ABA06_03930 [Parcubacteria bacterium C7867-001]
MPYQFQVKFVNSRGVMRFCNWPVNRTDGQLEWRMHNYATIIAQIEGGLDFEGTKAVLMHFGLWSEDKEYPADELRFLSPHTLLRARRLLERRRPRLMALRPINHLTNQYLSEPESL